MGRAYACHFYRCWMTAASGLSSSFITEGGYLKMRNGDPIAVLVRKKQDFGSGWGSEEEFFACVSD